MKLTTLLFSGLLCAGLFAGFEPGGFSVDLTPKAKLDSAPAAANLVYNGSFELPGTRPDGWDQKKQQGWCGYFNTPAPKNEAEKARFREIRSKSFRTIRQGNAPSGKSYLAIVTPETLKRKGEAFPNVSSKVLQVIPVPAAPAGGARYLVSLKIKGSSGAQFSLFSKPLKAERGKNKGLASSTITRHHVPRTWQTIARPVVVPAGTDRIDITLALYGTGEVYVDDIQLFRVIHKDRVRVTTTPAALTDRIVAVGENLPGMMTFVFDHDGASGRLDLKLAVELPEGFTLTDFRRQSKAAKVTKKGKVCYFSLMYYSRDRHLQDWYQYQSLSLMVESKLKASGKLYPVTYWVEDTDWKGEKHTVNLKIIPTFQGQRPKLFKSSAMLGHEIEFGPEGTKKFAEFYRDRSGFSCVDGAAHNPLLAKYMKEFGFERFDEDYFLANAYRLGEFTKPKEAAFLKADGSAFPASVCPAEVYMQGPYFQKHIRPYIEKRIVTKDVTDTIMPNWEPYEYDSKGCFCDRCKEEFIRYCKGKVTEEAIRKAWPKEITAKFLPVWEKFRSHQHGLLLQTLEKVTFEAGKKAGKESHFIPEITQILLLPSGIGKNAQYAAPDYAWNIPWIEPWGPYVGKILTREYLYEPTPNLATWGHASEINRYFKLYTPAGKKRPGLLALPHGWQSSFWVTEPESLAMDMCTFFVLGWEGAFNYYFPRGYDYRWWRVMAQTNDLIARTEDFVRKGKDVSAQVKLEGVTGLPKVFFNDPLYQEVPGVMPRIPGMSQLSPVQYKAFALKKGMLVAVGNYWVKGEHFFNLKIKGLSGSYEVKVPGASRGVFSGRELEKGILMQVGAQRWQFITITPAKKSSALLFDNARMNALLKSRRPVIHAALNLEKKLYEERFKAPDYSALAPVKGGKFSAEVKGNLIEILTPAEKFTLDPLHGGEIIAPVRLAAPGFWWTAKGPLKLTKPFAVDSMKAIPGGVEIVLSRKLVPADKTEVAGLNVCMTYTFKADMLQVRADLHNTTVDSIPFAFRFINMPEGDSFRFGKEQYARNRAVTLFRQAPADGELDSIYKYDRVIPVKQSTSSVGRYRFSFGGPLYGIVAWDSANQKCSTFEGVFPKVILRPGAKVSCSMTVR